MVAGDVMNFRDTYPLGVRVIAVDQGSDFAFVQATVHGDRVPGNAGSRSVELQFWNALSELDVPHPDKRYCVACGMWRHQDTMVICDDHLGLCKACEPNAGVMPPGYKRCRKCWKPKALKAFSADSRQRDGKQSWCKSCNAERMYTTRWHEREKLSA